MVACAAWSVAPLACFGRSLMSSATFPFFTQAQHTSPRLFLPVPLHAAQTLAAGLLG
jgi:hypothetical protein